MVRRTGRLDQGHITATQALMSPGARVLVWNPNPTLDVVSELVELRLGIVQSAISQAFSPGGKGTLVMRALGLLGVSYDGVTPIGGPSGELVARLIREEGIRTDLVMVEGETRAAITLVEASGAETNVNGPGPSGRCPAWRDQLRSLLAQAGSGDYDLVVVAGRPPLSSSVSAVADLCASVTAAGVRLVVDLGSPFLPAIIERARPWLIKVNRSEAADCLGATDATALDIVDLANRLVGLGARNVVLTDGPNSFGGVLLDRSVQGRPPSIRLRSAIGCGDCYLAGLIHGLLSEPEDVFSALAWGAAVGSASAEELRPGFFLARRAAELRQSIQVVAR